MIVGWNISDKAKNFILFAAVFLFFVFLPAGLRLGYHCRLYPYELMWENLWGAGFSFDSFWGPKPFIVIISYLGRLSLLYPLAAAFNALLVTSLAGLSRRMNAGTLSGIFGALLYFFCGYWGLTEFFQVYWMVFYVPLVFFSLLMLVEKKYGACVSGLFFAGLIRPEAWVYAGLALAWIYRQKKFRKVYLWGMSAPLLWSLVDYRISGDLWYSFRAAGQYSSLTLMKPTYFREFWPYICRQLAAAYNGWLLAAGAIGLLYCLWPVPKNKTDSSAARPLACSIALPFLLYWLESVSGKLIIYPRFFAMSAAGLCLCVAVMAARIMINQRILSVLVLSLVFAFVFKPDVFLSAMLYKIKDNIKETTSRELADFLQNHLSDFSQKEKILVGDNMNYLSLRLGRDFSRRTVSFEAAGNTPDFSRLKTMIPALAVWQFADYHCVGIRFDFLGEQRSCYLGRYKFTLLYVTSNRLGSVYRVEDE